VGIRGDGSPFICPIFAGIGLMTRSSIPHGEDDYDIKPISNRYRAYIATNSHDTVPYSMCLVPPFVVRMASGVGRGAREGRRKWGLDIGGGWSWAARRASDVSNAAHVRQRIVFYGRRFCNSASAACASARDVICNVLASILVCRCLASGE
jgi:hypothetical protein